LTRSHILRRLVFL